MAQVLPNFNDSTVIKYGIPEIYEAMPELFADRDPAGKPTIAVIDQGIDMSENRYDIWKNAAEIPGNGIDDDGNGFIDDAFGYNFYRRTSSFDAGGGHGKSVANALIAPMPEILKVMNVQVASTGGTSHYTILDGVSYAIQNGALASNTSFGSTTATMQLTFIRQMREKGQFWLSPATYFPARLLNSTNADTDPVYQSIISTGAMRIDGSTITGADTSTMFYAYAGAVSFASPQPGSVLSMLKVVDPSLTFEDLRNLLIQGAIMLPTLEGKCRHGVINHKKSLEALLGHSIGSTPVPVPVGPVFNVKDFGAVGDLVTDDTVAIREALEKAKEHVRTKNEEAIVAFPVGKYGVSIQPKSGSTIGFSDSFVFTIDEDNITFLGTGTGSSELVFHTLDGETGQPMADPDEHFTILGNGREYGKVVRGGMFQMGPVDKSQGLHSIGNVPVNIKIKGLTIDGGASPTTNTAVGGQVYDFKIQSENVFVTAGGSNVPWHLKKYNKVKFASNLGIPSGSVLNKYYWVTNISASQFQLTDSIDGEPISLTAASGVDTYRLLNGIGWDMSHKGFALHGGDLDNIKFENTHWKNWRGEIIHAGGDKPRNISFINSTFELTDASMISCGGNILIDGCTLRNGYNGIENYSRMAWHGTTVINSKFENDPALYAQPHFGVVYIGLPDAKCHIENNHFSGWNYGVFLSESAFNVKILNNTFDLGKGSPLHWVRLGMYPNDAQHAGKLNDVLVDGNTFIKSGETPIYLQGIGEMKNFTISNNRFLNGWRFLGRSFVSGTAKQWENFKFENNYIEAEAGYFPNDGVPIPQYINNEVWPKLATNQEWPYRLDLYYTQSSGSISRILPASPWPIKINNHSNDSRNDTLIYEFSINQTNIDRHNYPTGSEFTILSGGSGWVRLHPENWGNFDEPILLEPLKRSTNEYTHQTAKFVLNTDNGKFDWANPWTIDTVPEFLTDTFNVTYEEGSTFSTPLEAQGGNGTLTYSIDGAPDWISVNGGNLVGTAGRPGFYPFSASVADEDGDTDSMQVIVAVRAIDSVPILHLDKTSIILEEGDSDIIVSTVPQGNWPFTFFLENNPEWITIDEAGKVFITESVLGTYDITVGVRDLDGDIARASFNLYVKDVDSVPVLQQPENVVIPEDQYAEIQLTATDGNGPLTYSIVSGAPAWMEINPTTGVISGTPSRPSNSNVKVRVVDADGDTDEKIFNCIVEYVEPDLAPIIVEKANSFTALRDQPFSIQYEAISGDPPLTWEMFDAPSWLQIDQTGLVYYDGAVSNKTETGKWSIDIGVKDKDGDASYTTLNLKILNRPYRRKTR